MTTLDTPSLGQALAYWLANKAKAREASKASKVTQTVPWFVATVRIVLHLAGFGSLTFAGFTWNITAGLVVAGISCFALSWLTTTEERSTGDSPQQRMR